MTLLTAHQRKVLIYTKLGGFILSFSATLGFIIWVMLTHTISALTHSSQKEVPLDKPIFRMFFCLQLVTCIENMQFIFELFHLVHKKHLCLMQACMIQYFGIARCIWCVIIGAWMFAIIVLRIQKRNIRRYAIISFW